MNRRDTEAQRELEARLTEVLGARPVRFEPLSGGMIGRAFRVELENGAAIFLKTGQQTPPDFFALEAKSLDELRLALSDIDGPSCGVLRIPQVLAYSDAPAFIALEYIAAQAPQDYTTASRRFGAALAALHRQATSR